MINRKKFKLINKITSSVVLLALLLTFTGCASYSAMALSDISNMQFQISNPTLIASADPSNMSPEQQAVIDSSENSYLQMVTKVFTEEDCQKYLDRNVIEKGYQPVQIFIKNKSSKSFYISPDRIEMPLVDIAEVARSAHTSTAKRVGWYCVGGLFFSPLLIPAVVDGIKSSEANKALDADFQNKAFKSATLQPHSKYSGLIFIPVNRFEKVNEISVTLVNADSKKPTVLTNKITP